MAALPMIWHMMTTDEEIYCNPFISPLDNYPFCINDAEVMLNHLESNKEKMTEIEGLVASFKISYDFEKPTIKNFCAGVKSGNWTPYPMGDAHGPDGGQWACRKGSLVFLFKHELDCDHDDTPDAKPCPTKGTMAEYTVFIGKIPNTHTWAK